MKMTLAKACEFAGYPQKNLIDDRVIVRRETGGTDLVAWEQAGQKVCDRDDCASILLYAELRRAGQPVKFAGVFASRIRAAMREHPEADQLTTVLLDNGFTFTLPSATLDLATGFNSGRAIVTATLVDCRNLRARVQQAIDAYEPVIGAEDAGA